MARQKARILLTGVGGQGTLTATVLLARALMEQGHKVVAGEVHGMAQRGGVVESCVLYGGYASPRLGPGQADILLAFEPLEALRALPSLVPGGLVIASTEAIRPLNVALGKETYPGDEHVRTQVEDCAGRAAFLPALSLGRQAGNVKSANMVLLGALCAAGAIPLSLDDLHATMETHLKPALRHVNQQAAQLGAEAVTAAV